MVQQATRYREQSRIFMAQAFGELAAGDLPQASEKGWGAAAEMIKAIGSARGWEHNHHTALLNIAGLLGRETDGLELELLFRNAVVLHQNFYENFMTETAVSQTLQGVSEFVERAGILLDGWTSG